MGFKITRHIVNHGHTNNNDFLVLPENTESKMVLLSRNIFATVPGPDQITFQSNLVFPTAYSITRNADSDCKPS